MKCPPPQITPQIPIYIAVMCCIVLGFQSPNSRAFHFMSFQTFVFSNMSIALSFPYTSWHLHWITVFPLVHNLGTNWLSKKTQDQNEKKKKKVCRGNLCGKRFKHVTDVQILLRVIIAFLVFPARSPQLSHWPISLISVIIWWQQNTRKPTFCWHNSQPHSQQPWQ